LSMLSWYVLVSPLKLSFFFLTLYSSGMFVVWGWRKCFWWKEMRIDRVFFVQLFLSQGREQSHRITCYFEQTPDAEERKQATVNASCVHKSLEKRPLRPYCESCLKTDM
jgi:hypothetical protein